MVALSLCVFAVVLGICVQVRNLASHPILSPRLCDLCGPFHPNLKLQITDVHCIIHDCFARSFPLYTHP
jgi:hypothetical protein